MTAQMAEKLFYEGEEVSMCSEPLQNYFSLAGISPDFPFQCTALRRGYVGSWEIINERLYLIKINGTFSDGEEVTLESFFPGFPDRVFAYWYSETIRIPRGKLLNYIHSGFCSTFERDLFITLEKGVVTNIRIQENGKSDDPAGEEGYRVAGMYVRQSENSSESGS